MPIEILTRVHLPIAPVDPDELARKADIIAGGGGAAYDTEPTSPAVGQLWVTTDGQMSIWNGTEWLTIKTGPLVWNHPGVVWR